MIRPIGGDTPDFGRPSLNRPITAQGDTRWPSIRRGWNSTTLPAGGEVRCPTSGWIQFHGTYAGWSVSDGGAPLVLADYGDILPAPAQGVLLFTAGTGTLHLRAYNEEVGGLLAKVVTQNASGTPGPIPGSTGQSTIYPPVVLAEAVVQGPFGAPGITSVVQVDPSSNSIVEVSEQDVNVPTSYYPIAPGGTQTFSGVFYLTTPGGGGALAYVLEG